MIDKEISEHLASAVELLLIHMTHGYNTMPRKRLAREAVEEGMAALATYKAHKGAPFVLVEYNPK